MSSSSSIGSSINTPLPKDPYQNLLELQFKAKIYSILKNTQDFTEKERNSILKTSKVFSAFEILYNRVQYFYKKSSSKNNEYFSEEETDEMHDYLIITSVAFQYFNDQYTSQKTNSYDPFNFLRDKNTSLESLDLEKGWELLMQSIEGCNSAIEKIRDEKNIKAKDESDARIKAAAKIQATKKDLIKY
jgi:hypothetical protein